MELFSGLIFFTVLFAYHKKKGSLPQLVIPRSLFFIALGLITAAILSGLLNPDYSLKDLRYIIGEQRWLLLLFFISIGLVALEKRWKQGLQVLTYLGLALSLYSIVQAFTGIDIVRSAPYAIDGTRGLGLWRAKGFFSNTMTYSYTFGFILCLLTGVLLYTPFREKKQWGLYLLTTTAIGSSLFFTWTRGVWLALAGGLLVALIYKSRKQAVVALASCSILFTLIFSLSPTFRNSIDSITDSKYASNIERLSIWKAHWEMFLDSPIIGKGYRLQSRYLPEYYEKLGIQSEFISHAHNNFLQFLAGTGLTGFLFYVAFSLGCLIYAHKLFLKIPKEDHLHKGWIVGVLAALVTFHLGGMTEASFVDGEVRHMLVFTLATLFAVGYKYDPPKLSAP